MVQKIRYLSMTYIVSHLQQNLFDFFVAVFVCFFAFFFIYNVEDEFTVDKMIT